MKKSVNINLAGIIFHIDEDAYEKLNAYLSALHKKFGNNEEAKEIIADIENRISELLKERLGNVRQAVEIEDINYVIKILGRPDDYITSDEENNKKESSYSYKKKKLYRDPENAVIGGVCAGLGHYFNIDPILLRILFIVLLFIGGSAFLLYLILWIAIPTARTPIQKLEMKGEEVNLSNIEKKYGEDEFEKSKSRNFIEEAGAFIVNILKALIKVFVVFLGGLLIFIGILLILVFILLVFVPHNSILLSNYSGSFIDLFNLYRMNNSILFSFVTYLLALLPVIAIIYIGLKLIFKFNINDRPIWLGALILWLASFVVLIVMFFGMLKNTTHESLKTTSIDLSSKQYNCLYLELQPDNKYDRIIVKSKEKTFNKQMYWITNNQVISQPRLIIERTSDSVLRVLIEKTVYGLDENETDKYANGVEYNVSQKDSIVIFDPYFIISKKLWRFQSINVVVKIPDGKKVFISEGLTGIIKDIDINGEYWINEIGGKYWIMTKGGLEEVK